MELNSPDLALSPNISHLKRPNIGANMDRIPLHVDDVDQTMQLLRLLAANIIHFRSIMAEQQASNSSHSSDSSFCSGIESGTSIGPDISPDISTSTSSPEAQPCIAHLLIAPDHESAIVGAYANRLAVEMMANETRVLSLEGKIYNSLISIAHYLSLRNNFLTHVQKTVQQSQLILVISQTPLLRPRLLRSSPLQLTSMKKRNLTLLTLPQHQQGSLL